MQKAGLYVELKNPLWIKKDKQIDVAKLLLGELRGNINARDFFFDPSACEALRFGKYLIPSRVIQCFELETLQLIRELFIQDSEFFRNVTPPSVLLANFKQCSNEHFWFELRNHIQYLLDGIGPEKDCVLYSAGREFVNNVIEYRLAVHPWTERLEVNSLYDRFNNSEEELKYLFCTVGVDGVFSENVDVALRVAKMGYDEPKIVYEKCTVKTEAEKNTGLILLSAIIGVLLCVVVTRKAFFIFY